MITYNGLDHFIEEINNNYPEISNLTLAKFIMEYTDQDFEGMPDKDILKILQYNNISTNTQVIKITEDGKQVSDDVVMPMWTSNDGYMKITTSYSYRKSEGNTKYYTVWAYAEWLNYPHICLQDVFTLSTSGTFDSNYAEYGYVWQTFKCNHCLKTTTRDRYVDSASPNDGDLNLEYTNYVPVLRFEPISPRCDYCSGNTAVDTLFTTRVEYGIKATGPVNIEAGYAHKTVGIHDISVSIGYDGELGFSTTLGKVIPYIARPVTIG